MGKPTKGKLIIKAEFPKKENEPNIEAAGVEELMKYLRDFKIIIKRDLIDENIPIIVNDLEKQRRGVELNTNFNTAYNLIKDVLTEYDETKNKVIEIKDALDNLHDKIKGGNFELGVSEDDENEYGIDKNVFTAIKNSNPDEISFRDSGSDSDSNIKIMITNYKKDTAQNIARYFYKEKKGKLEEYLHFIYYFVNIMNHLLPPAETAQPSPAPAEAKAAADAAAAAAEAKAAADAAAAAAAAKAAAEAPAPAPAAEAEAAAEAPAPAAEAPAPAADAKAVADEENPQPGGGVRRRKRTLVKRR